MKKIGLLVFVVCIVSSIPVAAMGPLHHSIKIQVPVSPSPILDNGTPPDWATGNFSGIWGINVVGQPFPPAGWLAGYYSNMGIGRFVGVFALFNATNVTGYIGGILLGPFMLGIVGNSTTKNQTFFVGLGGANQTHFYWRIMGFVGPTFYMYGIYTPFHNETRTVIPQFVREKYN
jgi:hypothetical protein